MKAQSKKASVIEAIVNVIVGIAVAFFSQVIIFKHYNLHVSYLMNAYMTAWFTAVSITRSFVLRRVFNFMTEQSMKEEAIHAHETQMQQDGPKSYGSGGVDSLISSDTLLMTGERLPARETEAINHLTRRVGYLKQRDGTWKRVRHEIRPHCVTCRRPI